MPFKSEKQRRWMWANEPEMAKRWSKEEKAMPKMTDVFKESPSNLSQQLKTAKPIPPATINQQAQNALQNQKQTLQGVQKTQGAVVKMSKTDPQNPIANVFVQKPDGSADVLDKATGQLKSVPGIGQDQQTGPMKNNGIMGNS